MKSKTQFLFDLGTNVTTHTWLYASPTAGKTTITAPSTSPSVTPIATPGASSSATSSASRHQMIPMNQWKKLWKRARIFEIALDWMFYNGTMPEIMARRLTCLLALIQPN